MFKHSSLFIMLLAASFSLISRAADLESRTYMENSKHGKASHHFTFTVLDGAISTTLRSVRAGVTIEQTYLTSLDLSETRRWSYRNPATDTDITARREENRIRLVGRHRGKAIEKNFKINSLPWNQLFNIGFEAAARRGDTTRRFWSIGTEGPGEMRITTFKAKLVDEPDLRFNGKSIPTRRYQIALTGLLSMFWKGYYWYRLDDGCFIRYREKGKEDPDDPLMELIPSPSGGTDARLPQGTEWRATSTV
jgi:hypothetical protein